MALKDRSERGLDPRVEDYIPWQTDPEWQVDFAAFIVANFPNADLDTLEFPGGSDPRQFFGISSINEQLAEYMLRKEGGYVAAMRHERRGSFSSQVIANMLGAAIRLGMELQRNATSAAGPKDTILTILNSELNLHPGLTSSQMHRREEI